MRRGRPAANAIWGNRRAVLAGDFLYARASSIIVEDGSLEIVESYDVRRTATVSLVPSNRVPPMGYKNPDFNLDEGIRQIGLKISAQSDRVRGAGYRFSPDGD